MGEAAEQSTQEPQSAEGAGTQQAPSPPPDGPVTTATLLELARARGKARREGKQPADSAREKPKAEKAEPEAKAEPEKKPEEKSAPKDEGETDEEKAEAEDAPQEAAKKKKKPGQKDVIEGWAALKRAEKNVKRRGQEVEGRESKLVEREKSLSEREKQFEEVERLASDDPVAFIQKYKIDPAKFARSYIERQKAEANMTPEERARRESQAEIEKLRAEVEALKGVKEKEAEETKEKSDTEYWSQVENAVRVDFEKTLGDDGATDYPTLHLELDPLHVARVGARVLQEHFDETGVQLEPEELFAKLEAYALEHRREPTNYDERRARARARANDGDSVRSNAGGPQNGQGTAQAGKRPETITNQMASAKATSGSREPASRAERRERALQALRSLR